MIIPKLRYQIAFLFIIVFMVFSPAISGELITGDDNDLLERLEQVTELNLKSQFFRSGSGMLYYRPLTNLTYRFDKLFWDLNTEIMHIENILLHCLCALLVLLLTRKILLPEDRDKSFFPLIAAFLFALHPLTSESVNWISGRWDIAAGFFLLLSAFLLLHYREQKSLWLAILAFVAFALATFCKEVAVAFLPGALCMLFAKPINKTGASKNSMKAVWATIWLLIPFAVYFAVRFVGHSKASGKIGLTLMMIFNDLWQSTFVCLRGIGFYFKKLFLPLPLNFAIIEVDPLYELLGITVVIFVLYLLAKRSLAGAYVVAGAFLITPSFLLMFNQIAWTPYAERYLYIPLGFLVPAFIIFVGQKVRLDLSRLKFALVCGVLVFFAVVSFHRSTVWAENVQLWGDTARKSPRHLAAINDYGLALYNVGLVDEAIEQFHIASQRRGIEYAPRYGANLGVALMKAGRLEESQEAFVETLERSNGKSKKAKEGLRELYDRLIEKTSIDEKRQLLEQEFNGLLEKYNEVSLN